MTDDPRFTTGLFVDVRRVLADHGYVAATEHANHARVLLALLDLVRTFEGRASTPQESS